MIYSLSFPGKALSRASRVQPRSINPALSFLQETPVTPAHTSLTQQNFANAAIASSHIIKNYQQSSFQQQKPTHKPVIVIPQTTSFEVLYHIPATTAPPVNLGKRTSLPIFLQFDCKFVISVLLFNWFDKCTLQIPISHL